jgi:hypothetical protein
MELVGSLGVATLLAAYASWGIGFTPFVVLEGTWCLVALASMARPRAAAPAAATP